MSSKVALEIVKGRKFEFAEHDTFIFGRAAGCHAHLPDDTLVSRHHFPLEITPPLARLRDLGSLNATHVNNRKCGGRKKGETPEQGAQRKYPAVDLHDGDRIKVGGYIVEQEVGRGSFGAVYLARRIKDNQRVALKVMLSRRADVDKSNLEPVLREMRNISSFAPEHC